MRLGTALGAVLIALAAPALATAAEETAKRGWTLTYMIPADAPPSFDGHRESTFATVHAFAPFYSLLIRNNPQNPASSTDFVCDLCTAMPQPSDDGKTYTFKIRSGVKFHDGSLLTAEDVAATFSAIIFPPESVLSARVANFLMVDKVEAPDPSTVVFRLKFPTAAFLPSLANPFNWIYKKAILDKDPHWYEKNILGTGPFKFAHYETGQSVTGVRNPDYYQQGLPYLDGFVAIYADKQATRVDAIRSDRAALEFRGMPPSARDELVSALGDKITVQEGDWDVGSAITPNHKKKPFDDVRVRRALTLAIDRWGGVGLHVTQKVVPTGPWFDAMRNGDFDVVVEAPGWGIVNPPLDVQKVLPASVSAENYGHYEDAAEIALYEKMLHETDPARQRELMRRFETYVLDEQAHEIWALWWHRIVPYRSYLKGFKIAPTHFINQDLARLWLDK